MKHFDENGNFIEFEPEVEIENEDELEIEPKINQAQRINYIFKKNEDERL